MQRFKVEWYIFLTCFHIVTLQAEKARASLDKAKLHTDALYARKGITRGH